MLENTKQSWNTFVSCFNYMGRMLKHLNGDQKTETISIIIIKVSMLRNIPKNNSWFWNTTSTEWVYTADTCITGFYSNIG